MLKKSQAHKTLLSPLFLIGLATLLLNDFYLKAEFHNFWTGKISDLAGLFVFPLFWSAFFPKRKFLIFLATAAFFVFWKSPYSQDFINAWNEHGIFRIGRTVDYSDLFALAVLPFAWIYFGLSESMRLPDVLRQSATFAVAGFSIFAFAATSPARMQQMEEYNDAYKFENSTLEISKKLQEFKTQEFTQTKSGNRAEIFFNIELHEKVCDGFPVANFVVFGSDKSEIKLNSILYPCNNKLPDQREKLRKMFESEIINFLNDQRPY